jgi:broad specificity polyphosphatase/5'/3'-nucleotidase SurE
VWEPLEGSDFHAVHSGWISVTPMRLELTDEAAVEEMRGWELAK